MIKAVLWSRLAMTRGSIRNTHTQVLWEKGFRGETVPVLVTKYGQKVIPNLMLHYTRLIIRLVYITKDIAMQLYTQFLPFSAHATER